MGCLGCILHQKRLRLRWKVDECKPLLNGRVAMIGIASLIAVGRCRFALSNTS
jgi:hypothetical protein